MQFGNPTVAGFSTVIWQNATRTLTGFGAALTNTENVRFSLSASSNVIFLALHTVAMLSVAVKAGAAGALNLFLNDGVNQCFIGTVAAANTGAFGNAIIGTSIGFQIVNADAANAATYSRVTWEVQS